MNGDPLEGPDETDYNDYEPRPGLTHRDADWSGLRVLVAGLAVSGFAAADALAERGAVVTVVDGKGAGESQAPPQSESGKPPANPSPNSTSGK